ncbi:MAG TPA: ATP-binding protein [Burkholderiaceae bacterium]
MPGTLSTSYEERVLLIAPTRRDAEVTQRALAPGGVNCMVCDSLEQLSSELQRGVGALMMTDRALLDPSFGALIEALQRQPAWSSVPSVLLCRDRDQSAVATAAMARLRNVTLLDRPTSMRSMVSAVQAALQGRRWQYQIRDQMVAQMRAEQALVRADQRKDEFLATLAHELRNPLAPIKTGLELLKRGQPPGPDSTQLLDMMERQLSHMVKLIDELLDVSRIATGKVVLQRELVDMRSIIEQAAETSQPLVSAGHHQLDLHLPSREVRVIGDPSRLSQAIANLLNNAAKYTPSRGHLSVALAEQDQQAVVTVSDTGVGIPAEMLERVFEMFAQVDRTLDRAQGGLGIGLSLVRSLVALHGGTVVAKSLGIDRGSSFEIRLPAVATAQASMNGEHAGLREGIERRPLRIMVVDDNVDAANTLAMLLEMNGHDLRVEYSARAALTASQAFLPEAIFCDLGMPGMGGHEFASQLRLDRRFASTLLIAVTGWGGDEDRGRSRAAGFDHHLTKPADIDRIEAVLSRR